MKKEQLQANILILKEGWMGLIDTFKMFIELDTDFPIIRKYTPRLNEQVRNFQIKIRELELLFDKLSKTEKDAEIDSLHKKLEIAVKNIDGTLKNSQKLREEMEIDLQLMDN